MRFTILGTVVSALAVVAAAVPIDDGPTPQDAKHMKGALASLTKAINSDDCTVAKAQVNCLQNMLNDVAVHGYVEGEDESVKYITKKSGDDVVKQLWNIRRSPQRNTRDESSLETRDNENNQGKGRGGKGRGKGKWKGGKGRKGGKGKSSQKGGKGRGRSVEEDMNDKEGAVGRSRMSCKSAKRVLKVVRDFVPKSVKVGSTEDGKGAYYIRAKDEKNLKSKIRRAVLMSR
ncbi:uncharacterized protein DNG_05485 [Cephalotrichum gorgonifer]|uniref:Uncharacterized protein n=1 Tax=Cephalotrichum gorgonifer TaxID=2041049 RepID=A0AAE8MYC3_9PEZI|nr:uncharacterized protein DNG_05485 [Cephalotrichum gorgonifer]